MRTTLIILLVALCCMQTLTAQLNRAAYGIFGHYVYAMHTADFQALPNKPCCSPIFQDGSGSNAEFGLLWQAPLASQWTLSARLAYIGYGGLLSTDEATTFNIDGSAVPGIIRHQIDASLSAIDFEPMIGFRITDRLTLNGGLMLGGVINASYTQTEKIASPSSTAIRTNQLTVPELVGSGDIPNASSLVAALSFGLSFDIPIGHGSRWFITPEAFYSLALTNVEKNDPWKVNMIRAGLALKYSPSDFELPPPPPNQRARLVAAVKAYGMMSPTASEEPIVKLKVEEFLTRQHKPLLPYVFFGAGSAEFPLQYHQMSEAQTAAFDPEKFSDSTLLGVYYDMLNIVGKRMREHPTATLTLSGCNSNESSEKNNLALSQKRAETVKNYLVNTWGIAASRIELKSRNLPANPSNINKEEGIAENRRVELASNDPFIIAPLVTRDTTRISTPPIVRFRSEVDAQAGVGAYSISATQDNRLIQSLNGKGDVPEHLDWNLEDNSTTMPRKETPLNYVLRVTDREGQEFTTQAQQIPVEQITIEKKRRERMGDKEIDRYTLMSFGFSQAEVEADNQRYIESIRKELSPDASVRIVGSTDTMGDEDFNLNLSQQRAKSVANVLKAPHAEVRGVGEVSMFDNSLPEGRFYNRTVRLTIETPVQR